VLGADTGFFVAYANNNTKAVEVWQQLSDGRHTLVVSVLTINEILIYFYRRGETDMGQQWVNLMVNTANIDVVPVSTEIAIASARYRHGLGLPTVDSVILATFLDRQCEQALSTDSDFRLVDEQGVLPIDFLV
jgi:predicted nucleic acid-binding protein